jgi:nitroreductase/NAD-dependent dihydropyrimidine dehydrogenase PreA subunit
MPTITVHSEPCVQCGACADVCYGRDVFEMTANGAVAAHPDHCRLCGHCVAVCPVDAIEIDEIPMAECPPIERDQLPTAEALITTLRSRRSYRRFQDRPVPRDVIRQLISAARWIPTGYNRQYVDWIALDDETAITALVRELLVELRRAMERGRDRSRFLGSLSPEQVDRLIDQTAEKRKPFFFDAPAVLAAICDAETVCAREEATYATYNVMLVAERLGLGTCHIGSLHLLLEEFPRLQRRLLGIPDGKKLEALMVVGYPARTVRRMVPRRMPEIAWNPGQPL